jgi:hypothetical protein
MSLFSVGQRYPMRNGEAEVEVVATDLTDMLKGARFSVGGVVRHHDGRVEMMTWTGRGQFSPSVKDSGLDLLPSPIRRDGQRFPAGYIQSL